MGILTNISSGAEFLGFLSPFLGGDPFIVSLSTLAGYGVLSFLLICAICLIGITFWDNMLFLFSESKFVSFLLRKTHTSDKIKKANSLIRKHIGKNNFFILALAKLLYGVRIIIICLLARNKLKWRKFFVYDFIINIPYVLFLVSVGWLIGAGIIKSGVEINSIKTLGIFLLLIVFAFVLIKYFLHKIIISLHKRAQNKKGR